MSQLDDSKYYSSECHLDNHIFYVLFFSQLKKLNPTRSLFRVRSMKKW